MNYLLEDIIVIDAASFLAGPGAATIMADYGAKVIKIEPPGGERAHRHRLVLAVRHDVERLLALARVLRRAVPFSCRAACGMKKAPSVAVQLWYSFQCLFFNFITFQKYETFVHEI